MTRSTPRTLRCVECGEPVHYRQTGVGEYVTGIRQNRSRAGGAGGGANHLIDLKGTGRWLCRMCTDGHRASAAPPQDGLFG